MKKTTFLHTSDLHLDEAHPQRLEVLRWLISAAGEREAALFICGDLFDSDRQARILRPAVREIFDSRPQVKVFILPGNHDAGGYSGGEDYGRSVRTLSTLPFEVFRHGDLVVVAAPFERGSRLASALSALPGLKGAAVLMAHGTYFGTDSSFRREAEERGADYFPIHPRDLEGCPFSYLALGHFHSRCRVMEDGGATLCYPGSPTPVSRAETGVRKAALVSLDHEAGEVCVEELPVGAGFYYIGEEFDLLPGMEESSFSRLDAFLSENRDERAVATVRLTGVTQLSDARINETLEKLREAYSPHYEGLELDNRAQSYDGLIAGNSLVREFVKRLGEEDGLDERTGKLAVALGLRAFDAAAARRR